MPDQILIIEDDEATRYAYERALMNAGYSVAGFADYYAAAGALDSGEGAMLLLDIKLPDHTPDGTAIARMMRCRRPDLPMIFVTGHPALAEYVDAELGDLFMKPVDLAILIAAVRSQLGR